MNATCSYKRKWPSSFRTKTGVINRVLIPIQRQPMRLPHNYLPCFLYGNCRSVAGKLDSLASLCKTHAVNVICICETWLNDLNVFLLASKFPTFIPYHYCRDDRSGGGILILIGNEYHSCLINSSCTSNIELLQ